MFQSDKTVDKLTKPLKAAPKRLLDDQDGLKVRTYEGNTRGYRLFHFLCMPFSLEQLYQAIEAADVESVTVILKLKPAVKLNGGKVQRCAHLYRM